MYPAPFEYHRPESVDEAISLLATYDEDAKLLAGGHSLIPLLKLRFAQPGHLIDIRHIPGLAGIREVDGAIVLGATTTHWMIESSALLARVLPMLPEAASQIGDAQVRNMGTIGGSLAHADPSADLPAVMLAAGAELVALGPGGERTIRAEDFFVDLLTTSLAANEVLTQIRIPLPPPGTGSAYAKYPHPASRYAVVGVAAMLTVGAGAIRRAQVAITGVGAKAARERGVERALVDHPASEATIVAAAAHALDDLALASDVLGSAEWRRALARTHVRKAAALALGRA